MSPANHISTEPQTQQAQQAPVNPQEKAGTLNSREVKQKNAFSAFFEKIGNFFKALFNKEFAKHLKIGQIEKKIHILTKNHAEEKSKETTEKIEEKINNLIIEKNKIKETTEEYKKTALKTACIKALENHFNSKYNDMLYRENAEFHRIKLIEDEVNQEENNYQLLKLVNLPIKKNELKVIAGFQGVTGSPFVIKDKINALREARSTFRFFFEKNQNQPPVNQEQGQPPVKQEQDKPSANEEQGQPPVSQEPEQNQPPVNQEPEQNQPPVKQEPELDQPPVDDKKEESPVNSSEEKSTGVDSEKEPVNQSPVQEPEQGKTSVDETKEEQFIVVSEEKSVNGNPVAQNSEPESETESEREDEPKRNCIIA